MSLKSLLIRWLGLVALSVWAGGFAFYGAVVVPILHDSMDSLQAGEITRRATDRLNASGGATVAIWWLIAWLERGQGGRASTRARLWFLATSTLTLLGLVVLHGLMDARLDAGRLRDFYPWHRAYLIISTVQWVANLGLMAAVLANRGPACNAARTPRDSATS